MRRIRSFMRRSKAVGVSLIAMAIMVTVVGTLGLPGLKIYKICEQRQSIEKTADSIALADEDLRAFIRVNGHLPCPPRS